MNYKPILIVSGEPFSVFLELFFKAKKNNTFKKPIIIITSQKLLLSQMKRLNFNIRRLLLNYCCCIT